nr:2149_t:CDS:2 [Entrophospora candida]
MVKVAVLGASGGIGQPLSLLLKLNEAVTELALYDIVNTPGVAADLSHINTPAKVQGYLPNDDGLKNALTNVHTIVIPAGVPRKPGMTRDDLFKINAGIVQKLATDIAKYAPKAFILVISNPVNSTVPIVAEVLKKHNVFDPKRLFGVTTLDIVRASTFVSSISDTDPRETRIPVVGGHSGVTIIPLLSQVSPSHKLTQEQIASLTNRIQFGGDEVVKAKDGTGSATLSMAHAGAVFASSIFDATIKGKSGIVVQSYINLNADKENSSTHLKDKIDGLEYFSSNIELGPNGVSKIHPIGNISEYEKTLLNVAIPELKANIDKAALTARWLDGIPTGPPIVDDLPPSRVIITRVDLDTTANSQNKKGEKRKKEDEQQLIVDYEKLEVYESRPNIGDNIAYKVIELSDNYTPGLSKYKEATIIGYEPITNQVTLTFSSANPNQELKKDFNFINNNEFGKFSLYDLGDEYILDSQIEPPKIFTIKWEELHDVRKIIK